MSKVKPEVGDVWMYKHTNIQYHIYCIFEDKLIRGFNVDTGRMDAFCLPVEDFIKLYTYIGKAKGSISDLFEIKE